MLSISPLTCLHDEFVDIGAKNLTPGEEVTLTSNLMDIFGKQYYSYTHYRADANGTVNLSRDLSLGGTYEGVFPMGPITNTKPNPDDFQYKRYLHRDVTNPMKVKFHLLKGHLDNRQSFSPDSDLVLDSVVHERIYLTKNTKRIPVREGRIRGTLFLPEGDGPFPGVLDLFGIIGGIIEFRAAQFAARGIAALTMGYFDFEDLPKDPKELELSYFEEGIKFLLNHEKIRKSGVGVLGLSKGADLAISIGTFIPEVKAVVCINGLAANGWVPLVTKDRTILPLGSNRDEVKVLEPGIITMYNCANDPADHPECQIPIQDADAEFLFIYSEDDRTYDFVGREAERVSSILKAHGKSNYKILKYKGAGHILEPPYSPCIRTSLSYVMDISVVWGGKPKEHTAAMEDSWKQIQEFFNRILV